MNDTLKKYKLKATDVLEDIGKGLGCLGMIICFILLFTPLFWISIIIGIIILIIGSEDKGQKKDNKL